MLRQQKAGVHRTLRRSRLQAAGESNRHPAAGRFREEADSHRAAGNSPEAVDSCPAAVGSFQEADSRRAGGNCPAEVERSPEVGSYPAAILLAA